MDTRQKNLVEDGLVSLNEAMKFLSISRSTLYELMHQGMLPWSKIGRSRRIPRQALLQLAQLTLRGGQTLATLK